MPITVMIYIHHHKSRLDYDFISSIKYSKDPKSDVQKAMVNLGGTRIENEPATDNMPPQGYYVVRYCKPKGKGWLVYEFEYYVAIIKPVAIQYTEQQINEMGLENFINPYHE